MPYFGPHFRVLSGCALLAFTSFLLSCEPNNESGQHTANQDKDPQPGESERSRIEKGFELSPVPLDLEGKDRDLVGLGSYIVNTQAACTDCHTNPPYAQGGNPFHGDPEKENTARYLAGGNAFGPIISTNITPDAQGRPAGLTLEQFITLMRTGSKGGRLLQVMPWPVYQKMTDHDLGAIYEYLRAIPHVAHTP